VKETLKVYINPMPAEIPIDNFSQFLPIFLSKHDYPSFFLVDTHWQSQWHLSGASFARRPLGEYAFTHVPSTWNSALTGY
jgi:hypothetical protein